MKATRQALQRIGILGDIHCENERLATALEFFQTQALDVVCAVGDIVDGPGNVNATIDLLIENRVVCVRGNHERWLFAGEMRNLEGANTRTDLRMPAWEFLPNLPTIRRLETVAGSAMLCHGLGTDDMAGVWPADDVLRLHTNYALWQLVNQRDYEFIINGHTHHRLVQRFEHLTIINAGTLFRKHRPCFCIADFAAMTVQYYDLVSETAFVKAEQFSLAAPALQPVLTDEAFSPDAQFQPVQ